MDQWAGKVALVTGASAGIGLEIVRQLLKHKIIVVAASRRPHLSDELKSEVPQDQASNLHSINLDVACEKSIAENFKWIKENLKSVHIVINNAGVFTKGSLIDGPVENWKKTFDVNVMGLCTVTKEVLQIIKETGVEHGHIIHINSVAGHMVPQITDPSSPIRLNVYPASKYAVTALAETLRWEILTKQLKVKVTSISPGLVKTDIFKANNAEPDGIVFNLPHLATKDIADAVVYALSTPPGVNVTELTIQPMLK